MKGIELLVKVKQVNPHLLRLPGRTDDKDYFFLGRAEVVLLWKKYRRWARWHGLLKWRKNSNDCDDMAREFVRYVIRHFKKREETPAITPIYSLGHCVAGIFDSSGTAHPFEIQTGKFIKDFKIIEIGRF